MQPPLLAFPLWMISRGPRSISGRCIRVIKCLPKQVLVSVRGRSLSQLAAHDSCTFIYLRSSRRVGTRRWITLVKKEMCEYFLFIYRSAVLLAQRWSQFAHPGKPIISKPVSFLLITTRQLNPPHFSSVDDLLAQEECLAMWSSAWACAGFFLQWAIKFIFHYVLS